MSSMVATDRICVGEEREKKLRGGPDTLNRDRSPHYIGNRPDDSPAILKEKLP